MNTPATDCRCADCGTDFLRKDEGNRKEIRCGDCQVQFRVTKKTALERWVAENVHPSRLTLNK